MPIDYKKYHPNWKNISRFIREYRAKNKCEVCGVPNYAVGYRSGEGVFVPISGNSYFDLAGQGLKYPSIQPMSYKEARELADERSIESHACDAYPVKFIVIVLTVAHLDHDVTNNSFFNLMAMCQKCHLAYDKKYHANSRRKNKLKNQLELF